jgi:hypothetical protein
MKQEPERPADLAGTVGRDLNNSLEGGYDWVLVGNPHAVAVDLINFADYPDTKPEELVPHVKDWQSKQDKKLRNKAMKAYGEHGEKPLS